MALFLEESLYRGLQWAVFEPNDEPLWSAIRLNVGSFMQALFQKQAFQGQTPDEAYLVKCDSETTTQTGDPSTSRKSPGRTEYDAITLERGVTYDPAFEAWAASVWAVGAGLGAEVSLASFRKDILLDFFNEAGQKVISYKIFRCWVSEYQALPDLDANANAVAIQHIKLENEGWERDTSVTEPPEPSFTSTHA